MMDKDVREYILEIERNHAETMKNVKQAEFCLKVALAALVVVIICSLVQLVAAFT